MAAGTVQEKKISKDSTVHFRIEFNAETTTTSAVKTDRVRNYFKTSAVHRRKEVRFSVVFLANVVWINLL